MKSIIYKKFKHPKEALVFTEIEKPTPKSSQVLIKVKASSMYYLDYSRFEKTIKGGKMPIFSRFMDIAMKSKGKVIGSEVSGIVEAVGNEITNLKKGDEVFASTSGLTGGMAEYALADKLTVYFKPTNLSYEEAATIPLAGITALGAIKDAGVKKDHDVLIYGASGGVGQYLVQIAKAQGAIVTAVCSTRNIENARVIGADYTIDYKKEDFTKKGKTYDVIISANGYQPLKKFKKLLNNGGRYIAVGNSKQMSLAMILGLIYSNKDKKLGATNYFSTIKKPTLPYLKELVEAGKIKPFVEKVYSSKEIEKAIIHLCENHARGKVAFKMDL